MIIRTTFHSLVLLISLTTALNGPPQAPTFNPDGKRIGKEIFASHESKIRSFYNSYIPKHKSDHQDLIRVVSWNVHMLKEIEGEESNWMGVIEDIEVLNADIVVMQEVPIDGEVVRQFEVRLIEMGYEGQFKAYSKDPKAKLGVMVVSRYPIIEKTMVDLGDLRVLADAKIDLGLDQSFNILGTHLEVSSSIARLMELTRIQKYVLKKDYQKFMLVGDFNAKWDSPEIKFIRGTEGDLFGDSFEVMHWDVPNYTCWSGSRIDYIFLGPQSRQLNGTFVYHGSNSDHLPLIADIWITETIARQNMIHLAMFIFFFIIFLYIVVAYYAPPSTWNRAYRYIEDYDDELE